MLTKGATRLCVLAAAVAGWSCPAASEPRSLSCYLAALDRYAQADYPAVLSQTAAAVEDDPRMWQAWQLAGNARLALGDLRGAMTDYRRALDLHPDNPVLAETLFELGARGTAARMPIGPVRNVRPFSWSFASLGRMPALLAGEGFLNWTSRLSLGAAIGNFWEARAMSAGAFLTGFFREAAWSPFFTVGVYGVLRMKDRPAPGFTAGFGLERRNWNGATIQFGFFAHGLHDLPSRVFGSESAVPGRQWNTWIWPGLSIGYAR